MKKFYVFAAVAIAALASCTKSEVVYNQGQQEIGFRQFTGSMTKAEGDPSTSMLPTTTSMGVFSYLDGTETAYFTNAKFVYKSDAKWGGDTPYYWPLQGALDFVLYAPYQAKDETTNTPSYTPSNKTLKVTITDNSSEPQTDYLYGKDFYVTKKPTTPSNGVPVVLKHALSKVTIAAKAKAASIFTVTSIQLMQTTQEGSYTVTYNTTGDDFTSVVTGSSTAAKKDIEYVPSGSTWTLTDNISDNSASKLVVPSAQTSIVLKYKMTGSTTEFTATVDLASESAKWETGKHYTYNLTLTADEILFVPTVQDWDHQDASEKEVKN